MIRPELELGTQILIALDFLFQNQNLRWFDRGKLHPVRDPFRLIILFACLQKLSDSLSFMLAATMAADLLLLES